MPFDGEAGYGAGSAGALPAAPMNFVIDDCTVCVVVAEEIIGRGK
jgi:hypothetical protein